MLTEAVQAAGNAAAAAGNRFERAMYLNNLSLAWQATAERTRSRRSGWKRSGPPRFAVAAVPEHDLDRAAYLSNLSAALRRVRNARGDATLSEAVQAAQDAAAAIPGDHPERGAYLHNLSTVLLLSSSTPRTARPWLWRREPLSILSLPSRAGTRASPDACPTSASCC